MREPVQLHASIFQIKQDKNFSFLLSKNFTKEANVIFVFYFLRYARKAVAHRVKTQCISEKNYEILFSGTVRTF